MSRYPVAIWRDHPRIRGEHQAGNSCYSQGSGIIPAYAGSTNITFSATSASRDHPRIRGEHSTLIPFHRNLTGSSPHTRGAPSHRASKPSPRGIIPAYAGSTRKTRAHERMGRDHPRIRGEHREKPKPTGVDPGSSPHTRGAPFGGVSAPGMQGIIPAYAGSTRVGKGGQPHGRDHPRIRGEH